MKRHTHLISRVLLKLLAVLGIVAITSASTAVTTYADEGTPPPPENVPVTVVTKPSELPKEDTLDSDWPIERIETSRYVDENGWIHLQRVVIRRAPKPRLEPCPDTPWLSPEDLCYFEAIETKTDEAYGPGYGVQGHLVTKAERYGKPGHSDHHKVLKSTLWWTRDNPDWSIRDANYRAGYASTCVDCWTGNYVDGKTYITENSPFDPCWWNGTHSCVYIVDPWDSEWPVIYCSAWTPQGVNSDARVYHNGMDVGEVYVHTHWP